MQLERGEHQRCHWHVLIGATTEADWDRYIASLRSTVPLLQPGDVLLDIWHDTGRASPQQRQQFTTWFQQTPEIEHVRAHAVVTNSVISRGLLTAVNWVVRPPFAERAFSTPVEGLMWLQRLRADLDVFQLAQPILAAAPLLATLPWPRAPSQG